MSPPRAWEGEELMRCGWDSILCSNHTNSLTDALLLVATVPRNVSTLSDGRWELWADWKRGRKLLASISASGRNSHQKGDWNQDEGGSVPRIDLD